MKTLSWLDSDPRNLSFPPVSQALDDPPGLIAAGGDLSTARLIAAYRRGIFPWYSAGQPVLWWSPDPRAVLFPAEFRLTRSLQKSIRNRDYETRIDFDFDRTVAACAAPRAHSEGTWITEEMRASYVALHRLGHAHSVETWQHERLVGGLYGVQLGRVYFGESMFSLATDASKVALSRLVQECQARDIVVIDCQMVTAHLHSLGARSIARDEFIALLNRHAAPGSADAWLDCGAALRHGNKR